MNRQAQQQLNRFIRKEHAGECMGVHGRFSNLVASDYGRIIKQNFKAWREYVKERNKYRIVVELSFDDCRKNGRDSFSITADIRENGKEYISGCCKDEIAANFPELAPLIKWHMSSTDGPMYYITNTLYWLGYSGSPPNIEYARTAAVWSDMPESMLCDKDARRLKVTRDAAAVPVRALLTDRLPGLLRDFKAAMSGAGFVWPTGKK